MTKWKLLQQIRQRAEAEAPGGFNIEPAMRRLADWKEIHLARLHTSPANDFAHDIGGLCFPDEFFVPRCLRRQQKSTNRSVITRQ